MRILVISDIHANLTALEAVLAEAGEFDAAWCLGDLVGYGPDPNECIARIRELPGLLCIIGNHDLAALQQLDSGYFQPGSPPGDPVDATNPERKQPQFLAAACRKKSNTKM